MKALSLSKTKEKKYVLFLSKKLKLRNRSFLPTKCMNLHILNTFTTILKNDSKDTNLECVCYGLNTWQPRSLICVNTQYSACSNVLEGCKTKGGAV